VRSLLTIILGDADRLETLRVLVAAESCGESWETVTAISTLHLDFFAHFAPGIDHRLRIAAFIDMLAQVFWRRPMIGLSRVTSWRWLLPPTRSLTPVSVVVVATLRSRTAACRSAVSLASAFAHVLLLEGRYRVLLIKLNPGPLRVTKSLTHVRIVTALEYGCNPGDVGHRSPEAPLAYGSEFGVKLAMHGSHALIDPPSASCASLVPGLSCLTIGVIFVTSVGYGFVLETASNSSMGKSPSSSRSSGINTWREMSSSKLSSTSSVDSSTTVANGLPS
jgi:hypothetical protein